MAATANLLELLEEFEDAWQSGSPPALREFVARARNAGLTEDGRGVLSELVRIDLEQRWRHPKLSTVEFSTQPILDDYLLRFPELGPELPLDLILDEYRVRMRWGDRPSHADYRRRFPAIADALAEALPRLDDELAAEPLRPAASSVSIAGDSSQVQTSAESSSGVQSSWPSIPGYEVIEEIARGGMGAVYRLYDPDLNRDVAVKVLRQESRPSLEGRRRFLEEARITAQLQHPGIPPIHEIGQLTDGSPYLVMKLIKGRTLAELLEERPNPAHDRGRFLGIFEHICQTVAYAHARGVIHRDLKPSNVMVGAFGEVQVMDWGLAKVLSNKSLSTVEAATEDPAVIRGLRMDSCGFDTQVGSILGTLAYMPPEQAVGAVDRIDRRSDVFGLGAILCVILTGKTPYAETGFEALWRLATGGKLKDAFTRLNRSEAEPDLIALAKRCLAPDMSDRPRDADAVGNAVQMLRMQVEQRIRQADLDRVRAVSEREKAEARTIEERKRRRVQLVLAGSMFLLLLLAGVSAWWFQRQSADRLREGLATEQQRREAVKTALDAAEQALRKDSIIYSEVQTSLNLAAKRLADAEHDDLSDRLATLQKELDMVKRLDQVEIARLPKSRLYDDDSIIVSGEETQRIQQASKTPYIDAFRDYGVDLVKLPAAQIAARIVASPIRDHLQLVLERDFLTTQNNNSTLDLTEVISALDPEPDRQRLRSALRNGTVPLRDLLRSLDYTRLSPAMAMAFADRCFAFENGFDGFVEHEIRLLRATLQKRSSLWPVHYELAVRLGWRNRNEEAIGHFLASIAARPEIVEFHNSLGNAYLGIDEAYLAAMSFRQASLLESDNGLHFRNLGRSLEQAEDFDGAVKAFRKAIECNSRNGGCHYDLGQSLMQSMDFEGAVSAFQKTIALVDAVNPIRGRAAEQIERCKRLARVAQRLPLFLANKEKPATRQEAYDSAELCIWSKRYFAATEFYRAAFPNLEKLNFGDSLDQYLPAARACLLANAGHGVDSGHLTETERARLRHQAHEGLRRVLDAGSKGFLNADPASRVLRLVLSSWLRQNCFASVRDREGLNLLSADERLKWESFWYDVKALMAKIPEKEGPFG